MNTTCSLALCEAPASHTLLGLAHCDECFRNWKPLVDAGYAFEDAHEGYLMFMGIEDGVARYKYSDSRAYVTVPVAAHGCAQCGSPMDGEGWECPRCGTV